jgi:hypothetical protein
MSTQYRAGRAPVMSTRYLAGRTPVTPTRYLGRLAAVIGAAFTQPAALLVACPRCLGSTEGGSLTAYYLTGALLSLLPLAIFGAVFIMVRRQVQRDRPSHPSGD